MISRIIKLAIIFLIVGVHSMLFTGLAPGEETQVWTRQLQALRPRPQAAANDTIRVESGIASIANNAKVEFSAGNSPQFSAVNSATPAESRIDLLVINSSGTLEIIQGTQAATPSAPAYPSDKLAIAEVTITEVSPASPVITDTDIKDVRFFLNLGGGVSTATDNAYINVTGDTMTGVLTLSPASGNALVTTAGNVGIGTASPGAALDVAGAIRSSNGLTVSAGAVSLPANSINDTMVSDTLTASDLVASTGVVDSTEIVDAAIANVDIAANAAISGTKVDPNFGSQSIITSGSVGIGTTNVDSSALLDITSIAKGFLPPRMSETQRDNMVSPATGLLIYNTTTNVYNLYNGTRWTAVGSGSGANNLVANSSFESWSSGATSAPDAWTLSGTGATIAKDITTTKHSSSSAKPNTNATNESILTQSIYESYYKGLSLSLSVWVYATAPNRVRVALYDTDGTNIERQYSSYHTGASAWEQLTLTKTIQSDATDIKVELRLEQGSLTTCYFDSAICIEGSSPPTVFVTKTLADTNNQTLYGNLNVLGTIQAGTSNNILTTSDGLIDVTKFSGTIPVANLGNAVRLQATTPGTQQTGNMNVSGVGNFGSNVSVSGVGTFGGSIGIGVASPSAKLDIAGTNSIISNTTGNITISPSQNLIVTSGNVGIGTLAPGSKLTVSGGAAIDGNVGIGTSAPITKLEVTGLTISTDADNKVGIAQLTTTVTKDDTNTRTFSGLSLTPTFNTGAANTNTTFNVLNIDTTNTATTGLFTNLIKASYGGLAKFVVNSDGLVITGTIDAGQVTGIFRIDTAGIIDGSIMNVDIAANAAIVDTKLETISSAGKVSNSALSSSVSLLGQSIDSGEIVNGTIADEDIAGNAAIADTKLATISSAGKVSDSALSSNVSLLGQSIDSAEIVNGTISDVDIASNAAIADTKLSAIATVGKVYDTALSPNVSLLGQTIESAEITDGTIVNIDLASGSFANITGVGTLGTLTVSGATNLATTSGNVGIGTTGPGSKLDVTTLGLGVTQTTTSGLALVNTTAAAAAAQQISPALRWSGLGWKTDATAASQTVDFRSYVVPVQGAANPAGYLTFESSINGGAYGNSVNILSNGNVGIGTTGPETKLVVSGGPVHASTGVDGGSSYLLKGSTGTNYGLLRNEVGGDKWSLSYTTTTTGSGAPVLTWTSGGNVGIGTTAPEQKLQVLGNAVIGPVGLDAMIKFNPDSGTRGSRIISSAGTSAIYNGIVIASNEKSNNPPSQANTALPSWTVDIGGHDADTFTGATLDTFHIRRRPAGAAYDAYTMPPFLLINNSGNVGIGTSGPGNLLHVYKSSGAVQAIVESADNNAGFYVRSADNYDAKLVLREAATEKWTFYNDGNDADKLKIQDDGDIRVTIQQDGSVGIGTTGPAASLNVRGSLNTALTGTVSVTINTTSVTGAATLFTTELAVGDAIKIANQTFTVSAIADDTHLTINSNHTVGAAGATAYKDSNLYLVEDGAGADKLVVDKSGNLDVSSKIQAGSGNNYITTTEGLLDATKLTGVIPSGSITNLVSLQAVTPGTQQTGHINVSGTGTFGTNVNISGVGTFGGSIGIGVASPSAKLDIAGAVSAISNTTGNITITPSQNLIISSGNVGIGTTSPGARLDLKGAGTTTGFTFHTQDSSGTDRVVIQDNGNVGIGTTGPGAMLEVRSPDSSGIKLTDPTSGNGMWIQSYHPGIGFNVNNGSGLAIGPDFTGSIVMNLNTGFMKFLTGNNPGAGLTATLTERMRIQNDGNVGIGTTSPTAKLHVAGTSGVDGIRFPDGTLQTTAGGAGGGQWTTSGNNIYNANSANVGIGTTSPGSKLDVATSRGSWGITLRDTDGSNSGGLYLDGSGNGDLGLNDNTGTLKTWLSSNDVSYFMAGNVGIGTTGPSYKLDVTDDVRIGAITPGYASASPDLFIQGNLEVDATAYMDGPLVSSSSISTSGTITQTGSGVVFFSGNVGIGTTGPSTKLEVNGTITATAVSAPGLILQTVYNAWTATTTQSTAYTYVDATGSDLSITAKRTSSIFKITVNASGYYSGSASTNVGIKYVGTNTQILGVPGSSGDGWMGAGNGPANSSFNITRIAFHNPGTVAGTTYTYRAMLGLWNVGTSYINYSGYNGTSIITIDEIAQ